MSTKLAWTAVVLAASLVACAQGGSGEPSDAAGSGVADARPVADAPNNPGNDAPIQPTDAGMDAQPPTMVDAFVPPSDAPPGSNLFCAAQNQCTIAGECCFNFGGASPQGVCVTGTFVPFLNVCVPE